MLECTVLLPGPVWSAVHPVCSCTGVHSPAAWSGLQFIHCALLLGFTILLPGLVCISSSTLLYWGPHSHCLVQSTVNSVHFCVGVRSPADCSGLHCSLSSTLLCWGPQSLCLVRAPFHPAHAPVLGSSPFAWSADHPVLSCVGVHSPAVWSGLQFIPLCTMVPTVTAPAKILLHSSTSVGQSSRVIAW